MLRVDPDHDAVAAEFSNGICDKLRILERDRAEDHAGDAEIKICPDGLRRADAAADFDLELRILRDIAVNFRIDRIACLCAVKIDHVDPLGAGGFKFLCGLKRILGNLRCRCVVALHEPHALSADDVDCGKNDHFAISSKRRSIRSPFSPDFSG